MSGVGVTEIQVPAAPANPLADLDSRAVIADLAFGSLSVDVSRIGAGHLAFLSNDSLDLDLSDPAQRRLGNYELLERIGEGGMGVVYRARQQGLDREVAVKLLSAGPWASREFIERFQFEAQNAARMQHPNIIAIYEVGSAGELHFFSMRLVHGGSLAERLKRERRLSPVQAAQLLRTIAEAVDYAHRLGVLHLDLKPANVMLDENGVPHVADFGLARRFGHGLVAKNNEVSGTPSYMAPEQASARGIVPATDVWGLGAVLYELVTGEPPFLGDSPQATLQLVVGANLESPRRKVAGLSRDLEAIIEKCMAKDIAARYASARELADDLGRFLAGYSVRARPLNALQRTVRWARREPKLAFTALFALVALLAGLAASTHQRIRAEDNARLANERLWQTRLDQAANALHDAHPFAALPGLAANISEREALAVDAHDDRLRLAMIARAAPQLIDAIALGDGVSGVALSPDGKFVAGTTWKGTMHLFDTVTGIEKWSTRLTGVPYVFRPQPAMVAMRFTPDGRRILGHGYWGAGGGPEVASPLGEMEALVDAESGTQLLPPPEKFPRYYDAIFSMDGDYAIVEGEDETTCLMRTSDWTALSPRVPVPRMVWRVGNGGRHVVSATDNFVTLQMRDPRTLKVLDSHTWPDGQRISAWTMSPDGNSLLLGHADGLVEWADLARNTRERIVPGALSRIGWVDFSADGRWFGAVSDTGEVLVWDSATRQPALPLLHLEAGPGRHRQQLILDPSNHRVIASNGQQLAAWSTQTEIPTLLSAEFPHASPHLMRAVDYAASGLVATGGDEGELRLWRLPRNWTSLKAPASAEPVLRVPDGVVAALEGDTVRMVHARDGSAAGPAITLPQPAAFAKGTVDGRTLVAVAGHLLYVYDMPNGTLRFEPLAIPNDPVRTALNPDSRHVMVAYGDYRGDSAVDVTRVWDLASGRPVSDEVAAPPCDAIEYAGDGRTLLRCGSLLDAMTLRTLWTYGGSDAAAKGTGATALEIQWMHFGDNGSEVLALGVNGHDDSFLLRLDPASGAERERRLLKDLHKAENFAMLPDRRSLVASRPEGQGPAIWREDRSIAYGESNGTSDVNVLAVAPDGRAIARGTERGIALMSATDARWITPELAANDVTVQLAYTRDGDGIVARTYRDRWVYWDAAPDARPAAELLRMAALLHPDPDRLLQGRASPLASAVRAALRQADPGPAPASQDAAPSAIPPRQPGLSPLLFDLGPYYNQALEKEAAVTFEVDWPQLPPGLHRLLGVDYDLRGATTLSNGEGHAEAPKRVDGIRPGQTHFAALDVLVTANTMLRTQDQVPYAFVELAYRDGTRARLPIIYNRDIKERWRTDWKTPGRIAWRLRDFGTGSSDPETYPSLVAVRLVNPHPDREVASLALEAVDTQFSSPSFFAITAEPVRD
jgi:WD40 repeat protein